MVLKQETVPYREGYDIGIGVATATGSPLAKGAEGLVTPPELGPGESGSFTFRRIDTSSDLETELGIHADISGGVGLFSGDASFEFVKKCKIQQSSLAVMISAERRYAFEQMDEPRLTPSAAGLIKNGWTDSFAKTFGEYFVRGNRTGGRFLGVIRVDTKGVEYKEAVDTALSANYGLTMDLEARVHVSETLTTAQATLAAFVNYEGGHVTTEPNSADPLTLITQLYQAMDEWQATVKQLRKVYAVTLAPYFVALGPKPPNEVEIEHQRDVLIRCAKLRSQTLDKLNLVDYVLDPRHTDEFLIIPPPEGPDLPELQAKLAGDLNIIAEAASFAINNLQEAVDPETYMRTKQGVANFLLTGLPVNMPKHAGSGEIRVANFIGTDRGAIAGVLRGFKKGNSLDEIIAWGSLNLEQVNFLQLVHDKKVFMEYVDVGGDAGGPNITMQDPTGGSLLSIGATVRLSGQ